MGTPDSVAILLNKAGTAGSVVNQGTLDSVDYRAIAGFVDFLGTQGFQVIQPSNRVIQGLVVNPGTQAFAG